MGEANYRAIQSEQGTARKYEYSTTAANEPGVAVGPLFARQRIVATCSCERALASASPDGHGASDDSEDAE